MFIRKHPFVAGFVGMVLLFIVLNLIVVQVRSDCGLMGALNMNGCADDISRAGFPLQVWESGGFAEHEFFNGAALIGNLILIGVISVVVGLAARWWSKRSAG